jgi:hypothetical protein
LGKNRPTLPISILKPDGAMTVGNAEAVAVLNRSYVTKIKILRDRIVDSALATSEKWPSSSRPFSFFFANAGKIVKTIRGLKPTGALGIDTIPSEVFKKGVEVLAAPIAHMCNVSFVTGVVPAGLTLGKITRGMTRTERTPHHTAPYRSSLPYPKCSRSWQSQTWRDISRRRMDSRPRSLVFAAAEAALLPWAQRTRAG